MNALKKCSACNTVKPVYDFNKSSHTKDGLRFYCKKCNLKISLKWRRENREKYNLICNKSLRKRKKEDPLKFREYQRNYSRIRIKEPEKIKAREAVYRALKHGKINKPSLCEKCGLEASQLQGHHEDYSKKLNVKWLCCSCHKRIHSKYLDKNLVKP
jgi:hypothetical protein